jgi:protein O-mannosyl-transferase
MIASQQPPRATPGTFWDRAIRAAFRPWAICLLLAAITFAVFWPALNCEFTNFDDPNYVTANYRVQQGLSWESLFWAFRLDRPDYWHPLTWLSHILDCQFCGLRPAGHHLTSVLLHIASVVFLFLALRRATGALGRSALVAALYALHPLRVESVVWIAERKDVLSALFFMLALWAYSRYAEIRSPKSELSSTHHAPCFTHHASFFYILALAFFVLSLMSKPMAVTLPFLMLLLDYWPLCRFQRSTINHPRSTSSKPSALDPQPSNLFHLFLEKAPFFAIGAISSIATFLVQSRAGIAVPLPFGFRLETAPITSAAYLGKMLWPSGLAVFYPRPEVWPVASLLASVGVLAVITALVFWLGRRRCSSSGPAPVTSVCCR